MPPEGTYAPAEAARLSGFDPDTLRNLCNGPLQDFLDCERTRKRPRQFTERDIQILTLAHKLHHEAKLSYPEIGEKLRLEGVDKCLQEAIGATQYTRAVERDNQALLAAQAELHRQLEAARSLIASQREFAARTQVAVSSLDRKLGELNSELIYARHALARAADNEEEAMKAVREMGIWGWLFGGKKALLVRLEQAAKARAEAEEKVTTQQTTIQAFQVQELQRLLGLAQDLPDDIIEMPAPEAAAASQK